nr:DUF2971 domain-containing protein [Rhizobium mesosinicum]
MSQWRGYSAGGGIALNFDYEHLRRVSDRSSLLLVKCIYDSESKAQLVDEMLADVLAAFVNSKYQPEVPVDNYVTVFLYNFLPIAACFKHSAFSEEAEWRIVSRPIDMRDQRVDFRPTLKMITPYFKIDLEDGLNDLLKKPEIGVQEVMIGPTAEKDLLMEAVSGVIQNRNISVKSISHSAAPYREM